MQFSSLSDKECIGQAKAGCEFAFATLVERYAHRIFRFLCAMGISGHDAEELVQDTFVKAWIALERYDSRYALATWLYTIARRLAISHGRKNKQKHCPLDEEKLAATVDNSGEEALSDIWQTARAELSEKHFDILWLHYGEDLNLKEAAKVMEISHVHARVTLHRARKELSVILEKENEQIMRTGS